MRVAILNPPKHHSYFPPQDPALMSALLKRAGHEVSVFDANVELYARRGRAYRDAWSKTHGIAAWWNAEFVESVFSRQASWLGGFIERVAASAPDAVVLHAVPTSVQACRALAPRLRRRLPKARLALAGKMCHRVRGPQALLQSVPDADAVIVDEFDDTLPELAARWQAAKTGPCPGIIERAGGRLIDHGDRPPLKDLDSLPDFDWSAFPLRLYAIPDTLRWATSRGCVRHCVFCEQTIWEGPRRSQSAERLAGEIERQLARMRGISGLYFDDLLINAEPARLERFCGLFKSLRKRVLAERLSRWPVAELKAGRVPEFSWCAQGIIDERRMTPRLLSAMAESGCAMITYGLESGSARVVKAMRKGFAIPEAERVIRATAKAGIEVTVHYLAGFPGETEEDFEESIRFLERNRRWISAVDGGIGCYIAAYTPLGREPARYGVEEPAHPVFWRTRDGSNTFPVRWARRDRFFRRARQLGARLPAGWSFDSPDRWLFHRDYYRHVADEPAARRCEKRLGDFPSWNGELPLEEAAAG